MSRSARAARSRSKPRRPRSRKETGRKIVAIPADLRKDADAKSFIEQGAKALGRIDIMVNNAGSAAGGVIEHLTEDDWEKGLQLKFMGYVRCLRYALPVMVKQGGGRVVNLIGNDGVKPSYWEICPGAANAARPEPHAVAGRAVRQEQHQLLSRSIPGRCAPNAGPDWSRRCHAT